MCVCVCARARVYMTLKTAVKPTKILSDDDTEIRHDLGAIYIYIYIYIYIVKLRVS